MTSVAAALVERLGRHYVKPSRDGGMYADRKELKGGCTPAALAQRCCRDLFSEVDA